VAHVCGIRRRDGPGGDMLQAEFINGEARTTQPGGAPPTVITKKNFGKFALPLLSKGYVCRKI
jgi:hypothetical protein